MTTRAEAIDILAKKQTTPLAFWEPNGVQADWIKMIGTHQEGVDPRTKIQSSGNKILGKTCGSVGVLASIIWGPQNQWFDYPLYHNWPYPKNMWIVSSSSALREVIVPEMEKWFPRERYNVKPYKTKQGHKDYPYVWVTDTGFRIWLKSYDENPASFESTLIGFCLLSEPPPQQIYDAIPPRMSEGGIVALEMTPIESAGCGWIFEDLIDTGRAEILYGDQEVGCIKHGVRGRHPHQQITEYNKSIRNQDELIARAHGRPMHYQGAIFKEFRDNVHVVDAVALAGIEQIWFGIDPHWAKPPFCQWFALNRLNELRMVLEYPKYEPDYGYETIKHTDLTIEGYCGLILDIEKDFGFEGKVVRRVMDPYFGSQKYKDDDYTVQQKFTKHGVRCIFPPSNKILSIEIGHDDIREYLNSDNELNKPRITWERHCRNSIRAMKRYSIVKPKIIRAGRDVVSEKYALTEEWKHGVDPTRYVILCRPTYQHDVDPANYKGWRNDLFNDGRDSSYLGK